MSYIVYPLAAFGGLSLLFLLALFAAVHVLARWADGRPGLEGLALPEWRSSMRAAAPQQLDAVWHEQAP